MTFDTISGNRYYFLMILMCYSGRGILVRHADGGITPWWSSTSSRPFYSNSAGWF
jgi:hypothetical protein